MTANEKWRGEFGMWQELVDKGRAFMKDGEHIPRDEIYMKQHDYEEAEQWLLDILGDDFDEETCAQEDFDHLTAIRQALRCMVALQVEPIPDFNTPWIRKLIDRDNMSTQSLPTGSKPQCEHDWINDFCGVNVSVCWKCGKCGNFVKCVNLADSE